jgi:polysaccharide biosynthesis protein PslH
MKILILCNKPPYPPRDGGAIGIFNLSKSMASLGHDVHVLAMNTSKHRVNPSELPQIQNYHITYVDINTDITALKALKNFLFSKLPYLAERFVSKDYLEALKKILSRDSFDFIQFEGPYLWYCIDTIREMTPTKISMKNHNIEYEIWLRAAQIEKNILKKLYLYNLAKRVEKFEMNLYNRFDYLYAVTGRDKEIFINKFDVKKKPILIVPTGIDAPKSDFVPNQDNSSIFHLGALEWMPNQQGLIWFVNNVWPKILDRFPDLKFHIAGRNAPHWLVRHFNKTNIIYHGEIPDAHAFICSSGIMIVPVLSGGGMRVKVVEGMALGKPIVSTSIGAEGLDVKDGEDILIADSADTFADKICELVSDSELAKKLSVNAFKNSVEKYDNIAIARKVINFYKENGITGKQT